MKKLFLIFALAILLIGSVSAFEFDNVKSYDDSSKKVTITNAFGVGDKIADIKLDTPLVNSVMFGPNRKVAQFTINNPKEYSNALKDMEFYNNKNGEQFDRDFVYKYRIVSGYETVGDYEQVCAESEFKNGTECQSKQIGTHEEERYEWVVLDTDKKLPKGEIVVGIFTEVMPYESVEWIPTLFGQRVEEWATWTSNFNNQLLSYYKLDESSGSVLDSLANGTNGVNSGATAGATGIINTAYDFESGDTTDKIEYTSPKWCLFDSNAWTINMWFKPESSTAAQQLYGCDGSALIIYFQADNTVRLGKATVDNADASTFTVSDGVMTMVTFRKNSTATYYSKDGGSTEEKAYTTAFAQGTVGTIGNGIVGAVDGIIDEVGIWNRTLNSTELTDLYNAGAGISYVNVNENLTVTLVAPVNAFNSSNVTVNTTWTATDLQNVTNTTLFINGVANYTNTSSVNGTYSVVQNYIDGVYNWSVNAQNNQTSNTNSTNRTFTVNTSANITLLAPTNLSSFGSGSNIVMNASVIYNGSAVQSVTFFLDGVANETNTTGVNGTYAFTRNLSDGNHTWFVSSKGAGGGLTNATTRTLTVDTLSPNITSNSSVTFNYQIKNNNLTIYINASDTTLSSCWANWNGTNVTYPCANNKTSVNITSTNINNLTAYANDSLGNVGTLYVNWSYNLFDYNNYTYSTSVTEQSSTTFTNNFVISGGITSSYLNYNNTNTSTSSTSLGNDEYSITKTITTPAVALNTNITWSFIINGIQAQTFNQTVLELSIGDCSLYNQVLYNFTIYDEETKVKLVGNSSNTTAKVTVTLYNNARTVTITNSSMNYTSTNSFSFCTNNTLTSGGSVVADVQVQYDATPYASEFYNIQNSSLTNASFPTNISLYDLLDVSNQVFRIRYKDSSFLPVKDALVQIQRKYIDEGLFRTVEIPKTDTLGETLANLQVDTVIYTFVIMKNGEILGTFDNVLAHCPNPSIVSCEIDLNSFSTTIQPEDFTQLEDFTFTLGYNNDTRTVSSIFSIPSSTVGAVSLNVTLYNAYGNTSLCSDILSSASGTLSCIIPANYNGTAVVNIYKGGAFQGGGTISLAQSPKQLFGSNQVFLALFMYLTLIGVAITSNPVITGVLFLLGAIFGVALNITSTFGFIGAGATILWLFIAIILILIRGGNR